MPLQHSAFYQFVALESPDALAQCLRDYALTLTGSIIVAHEGINGAVAGEPADIVRFETLLRDNPSWRGAFSGMAFKHSACTTPPFGRLKVQVKERIVAFGPSDPAVFAPRVTAVSPQQWRELIARDDVVLIDNRNSFEFRLGHFANAIDPKVTHFSDFAAFVEANADAWKRDNKTVAMYCTGGIRCERVAPWMTRLGLKVAELDGGILNYFQELPDAERDWQGHCFVFDNRIALDTRLQQTDASLESVYEGDSDGQWRIARAQRLRDAVDSDG